MMRYINSLQIAVLVDTATSWGRNLIWGIISYSQKHGPWDLWIEPNSQRDHMRLPVGWAGDGIIAWIRDHATAQSLKSAGAPVVNVSAIELEGVDFHRVAGNLEAKGILAAEHLLNLGLQSFAYVSRVHPAHIRRHCGAFSAKVAKAGYPCVIFNPKNRSAENWSIYQKSLAQWIISLPKPVGILTWGNEDGRFVINICRTNDIIVPEQVAVLAGEDDPLLCEACVPSLSAVNMPTKQIGHEAAAILDNLMHGRQTPKSSVLVEPTVVAARRSTDTLAIKDMELARAVRFIHEHANRPIGVSDILRTVPISRRQLEIRFRETLGRTPAEEIRRVHFDRAKQLLVDTDMSIPQVAVASGFGSAEYLAVAFKRDTGQSPQKYRSQIRTR